MARKTLSPYSPLPVPTKAEDLPRYLSAELDRLAQALAAQPVAATIEDSGTSVPIGTTPNWQNPFIGSDAAWDIPGGNWDPTTGIWTCSTSGLYQVTGTLEVAPFGSGNKNYYAGIQIVRTGLVSDTAESTDSATDDFPLGVTISGQTFYEAGATIEMLVTAVHENQTGTVSAKAFLQILRVSG